MLDNQDNQVSVNSQESTCLKLAILQSIHQGQVDKILQGTKILIESGALSIRTGGTCHFISLDFIYLTKVKVTFQSLCLFARNNPVLL